MFAKLISGLALSLLTEKVICAVAIHILRWLVKRTTNDLDDKIVEEVAKALGAEAVKGS